MIYVPPRNNSVKQLRHIISNLINVLILVSTIKKYIKMNKNIHLENCQRYIFQRFSVFHVGDQMLLCGQLKLNFYTYTKINKNHVNVIFVILFPYFIALYKYLET